MSRLLASLSVLLPVLAIVACQAEVEDATLTEGSAASAGKCEHFCTSDTQCRRDTKRSDAYCRKIVDDDGVQKSDQNGCPAALCNCKDAPDEICPYVEEETAPTRECVWASTCPSGTKYSGKWRYASSGSGAYERECCRTGS
jgi:hypothetical protein